VARADRPVNGAAPVEVIDGVHLTRTGDALTATLQGDACLDSEAVLRQILLGALRAAAEPGGSPGRPLDLVLDLGGLRFCDLRGLDVLTDTVEAERSIGVPVTVTNAPPALERVRHLLGARLSWASRQGPDVPSAGPWWGRSLARLRTPLRR
jgi:anti-anti-sigma regulatory factor